jgi:hypothetical protein
VVALAVALPPHPHEVALIAELLDAGALAIAVVAADPRDVAVLLAEELRIGQVVGLSYDRVAGVVAQPLRSAEPAAR